MALLLLAAGAITWAAGDVVLGVIIWSVVLVNAAFSLWREHRAGQAMATLRRLLPSYARVVRASVEERIPSSDVVVGAVLVLAEGDHIPADARVIEEYGLRVNNATLTGEAVPARKIADASLREGLSEIERPNLVFAGTSVVSGTGRAIVYVTGMLSQFGRIARLTQEVHEEPSQLQRELSRMARWISTLAMALGVLVFMVGTLEVHLEIAEAFFLAIGTVVAMVPEGLPATVTLALAMAVQRVAQRGVLVKKLAVIEMLGHVSVICTDKSGTLTQNQMTVRHVWAGGRSISVSGVGYDPRGEFSPAPEGAPWENDLRALLVAAFLCNNARLTPPSNEHPQWSCLGDQTEAALRVAARKGNLIEPELNGLYPRIHELPFDARRKRMSTIHKVVRIDPGFPGSKPGQNVAFVKGGPREVLNLCTHILQHGEVQPLGDALREEILTANDAYARNALRVLALARKVLSAPSGAYAVEGVESGLTFLGLAAMMDPSRPEVADAIRVFRQAGIRMVMITGDYGLTAESLARRIGMLSTPNPLIVTGAEIEQMNSVALQDLLDKDVIYARMAPEHKLRLVAAFQARGEVVAVTGDGVNDAPALRKADIGVAMGISGSDVAKESADIILMDDNFGAIAAAIEEGRGVYANLRKFVTYIFTSNVPELLPFILAALLNIPLALGVKQILAIDLGTDLLPALALGMEKPEPGIMRQPPRKRSQPLVDRALISRAFLWLGPIEALLCYAAFFMVYPWGDGSILRFLPSLSNLGSASDPAWRYALAVTTFYAAVVMAQVGNAFACRTERNRGRFLGWLSNPWLFLGIAAEVVILWVFIYSPSVARLFGHVALPGLYWLGLGLIPLILYGLDWLRKWVLRFPIFARRG